MTLLLAISIMSLTMSYMLRKERTEAVGAELAVHARDVALMLQQQSSIAGFLWAYDSSTFRWKLNDLHNTYGAVIWLVSSNRQATVLGETGTTQEQLNDPLVIEQIYKVLSGEEIFVQGLIEELGESVITVGVPWKNSLGNNAGAVFLNVDTGNIQVDYGDMMLYTAFAGFFSLIVGTALALFISRRETRPIQLIGEAMTDFKNGRLDRRVEMKGSEDVTELAETFNQMAEELGNLEESRKNFVASVSHELRSPLTCIQGYVQGMQDGTVPEEARAKYLNVVLSETQRLTKLVSELLDLSRFESGNFPMNYEEFDINELIAVEMLKFEQRIEGKGILVEINFRKEQIIVSADRERIRQVVTNLLDNAVKFLEERGELTVITQQIDDMCYVTIKDNGPGIPMEDLPFIFERFYKSDKAHTSGMGTGLGLAIVKRILDQHGQTIKVQSGGGATFTFTLGCASGNV